jgi:hypothetical protein
MTMRCALPVIATGLGWVSSGIWSSAKLVWSTQSPTVVKFAGN